MPALHNVARQFDCMAALALRGLSIQPHQGAKSPPGSRLVVTCSCAASTLCTLAAGGKQATGNVVRLVGNAGICSVWVGFRRAAEVG
jgi:hypothetical protein